jgi:hypothetical protein
MPRSGCSVRRRVFGIALSMALASGVGAGAAHAAEYGTGPWAKRTELEAALAAQAEQSTPFKRVA